MSSTGSVLVVLAATVALIADSSCLLRGIVWVARDLINTLN